VKASKIKFDKELATDEIRIAGVLLASASHWTDKRAKNAGAIATFGAHPWLLTQSWVGSAFRLCLDLRIWKSRISVV
jgi:hypothetical protein